MPKSTPPFDPTGNPHQPPPGPTPATETSGDVPLTPEGKDYHSMQILASRIADAFWYEKYSPTPELQSQEPPPDPDGESE